MRSAPQVPRLKVPEPRDRLRGGLVTSIVLHTVAVWAIFYSPASDFEADRAPGGPGPRGGGGGGGSPEVVFLAVASPEAAERSDRTPEEETIDIAIPEVAAVEVDLTPRFNIPRNTRALATDVVGSGAGTGGGPGAGTGHGGGIGSGFGTGTGDAVGPGTGGEGGNVFPPVPRYVVVAPLPRPNSLKGKMFKVRFWVNEAGRVVRVETEPLIKDSSYRKKFLETMYEYSFSPAMTTAGERVAGRIEVEIAL